MNKNGRRPQTRFGSVEAARRYENRLGSSDLSTNPAKQTQRLCAWLTIHRDVANRLQILQSLETEGKVAMFQSGLFSRRLNISIFKWL